MAEPIQAVLFDAGQTLVRVNPSVGAVYAEVAARHGVQASHTELESAFRSLWKCLRPAFPDDLGYVTSEDQERAWWYALVSEVFVTARQMDAFVGRFDEFFDDVFAHFAQPEPWSIFEDVHPCLEALASQGIRCAVVSNWDHRLPLLLERLGLNRYFEFVLTSAEAGRRKPHPAIFERALERLTLSASQVAHIGDSYDEDVVGARGAGITPLLIDRRADCLHDDGHLKRLDELLAWLEHRRTFDMLPEPPR